jgi:hypothetical protein
MAATLVAAVTFGTSLRLDRCELRHRCHRERHCRGAVAPTRGAEYAATAARERGIASSRLPDPILRLGIDNLPINGPDRSARRPISMTMPSGDRAEFTDSDKNLRLSAAIEAG